MPNHLNSRERYALRFIFVAICIGVLSPTIVQPESYHYFADQRSWMGIPHFADVASNLIFTLAGAVGLHRMSHIRVTVRSAKIPLSIFFVGLLLTGPGSAYYHWAPDSQTILVDRLPMVIAFAGVIGTFLTQRVSSRMGLIGLMAALVFGGVGLAVSAMTGNLALYLVLQFGGLLGIVAGLYFFENRDDNLPWRTLIGWYALAKVLELGDHAVWELTQQVVSGHTLKHLAAGVSGVVLLRALSRATINGIDSTDAAMVLKR
jgi:hypothetical protein